MRATLLSRLGCGVWLCLAILAPGGVVSAADEQLDHLRLVTYGPEANTREGDDDFVQVIFFDVPADTSGPIRVRVYDPDAGGELDVFYGWGDFDTATRFVVYGGPGSTSAEGLRGAEATDEEIHAGERLADRTFAIDKDADETWVTIAELGPEQGERVGDRIAFKLVVEGVAGNDGNVFDVDVVGADDAPVPGLRMYSYVPTIHHDTKTRTAEVRILPSGNQRLFIHSFDAAGADLRFETLYRTIPADTSGQNKWSKSEIALLPEEQDQVIALAFGGQAGEIPNDATLYMADQDGVVVPIQLPISLIVPNRRPKVVTSVRPVDCERAELDASKSTDAEGNALSFEWRFPDEETSTEPVVTHRFGEPGPYEVRLRVKDDSGQVGAGTEVMVPFVMNAPPTAVAGEDQTVAPGDRVSFAGGESADADGRLTKHAWDFGDGASATGKTPRHSYEKPGRYEVALTVTDDSRGPCATGTDTLEVWVNDAPVAVPTVVDRAAVNEVVSFDAAKSTDADGRFTRYAWDFGDGATAEGEQVEHAYAAPGTYVARLTVTDDAGVGNSSTSTTHEIFVNDRPTARAGDDREVAIAQPFDLDANASTDSDGEIVHYAWRFGDGVSAEGPQVRHEYAAAGRYEVTLTVRDDSRTGSDTHEDTLEVVVNAPPVAAAGPDQRVTQSEVHFDASASEDSDGEIVAYEWSFGDGESGTGKRTRHVYAAPGTYRVDLRVRDDSPTPRNTADSSLEVVVNARPIADAGADRTAAVGQDVAFSAAGSGDPDGRVESYRWSFGDGATATGRDVTHRFAEAGDYTVELEVADDTGHENAVDHDDLRVVVNDPPVARLPAPRRVAPGEPVLLEGGGSFDPDGAALHHRWTLDGAPVGDGEDLIRAFDVPGSHDVTLVVDDGSGTANAVTRVSTTIHVNHPPIANAGPDQLLCEPVVRLDAGASADPDGDSLVYEWDFGDGSPKARGASVTHVYAGSGSYPVSLRVDDGTGLANSTDESAIEVRVNGAPVAKAGPDATHCAGEVVLFDGSASHDPDADVLKYAWDFGDGNTGDGMHPVHVFDEAGTFPVTLTVQDDSGLPCGRHRDRRIVTVVAAPVARAGDDVETCANVEVAFDGSASQDRDGLVDRYEWDFGDGARGSGPTPTHRYVRPGTYQVVLTVEGDPVAACDNSDVDELTVVVRAAPTASIDAPSVASPGERVRLSAVGENEGDVLWRWDFGDGESAEGTTVEHTYAETGSYEVALVAHSDAAANCGDSRRVHRIHVNQPPTAVAGKDRTVAPGEAVAFSAEGSADPDGVIKSYHWRFGDGHEAEGMEVFHPFAEPGRYEVRLTTVDDSGAANDATETAVAVTVNAAPRPAIDAPAVACVGQTVTLDASGAVDADGPIAEHRWALGDGATKEGDTIDHAYERPGVYTVTLLVDDETGTANAQARASTPMRVNRPPEARGGADRVVCAGDEVVFDGSGSRDFDGMLVAHRWTFPGGAATDGPTAAHVFPAAGRYVAELAVTDDSASACSTTVAPVGVHVNAPPIANAGGDRAGFAGGAHDALVFDARGSTDADGQTLLFTWDFGDGATADGPVVSHAYERPGEYVVRLRADDGTGLPCGATESEARVVISERTAP